MATKDKTSPAAEPTFEQAFQRLSEIVDELESGKGTLTEMTRMFEEGVSLSKICSGHLDSIEQKVSILLGEGGAETATPFQND